MARQITKNEAKLFYDNAKISEAIKAVGQIADPCPRLVWALENLRSVYTFNQSELKILHGEMTKCE